MFQRCNNDPQYKVRAFCGIQLQVEDYLRLGCTAWLDDSAIEAFFNRMIMKSTHLANRAFIITGSQHWKFAQSEDDAELRRYSAPYNVSDAHWILTTVNAHEKTITILDPRDLTNASKHLSEVVILKEVKKISENDAQQFDIQQQ